MQKKNAFFTGVGLWRQTLIWESRKSFLLWCTSGLRARAQSLVNDMSNAMQMISVSFRGYVVLLFLFWFHFSRSLFFLYFIWLRLVHDAATCWSWRSGSWRSCEVSQIITWDGEPVPEGWGGGTFLLQQSADPQRARLLCRHVQLPRVHVLHERPRRVEAVVHGGGDHAGGARFQPTATVQTCRWKTAFRAHFLFL